MSRHLRAGPSKKVVPGPLEKNYCNGQLLIFDKFEGLDLMYDSDSILKILK